MSAWLSLATVVGRARSGPSLPLSSSSRRSASSCSVSPLALAARLRSLVQGANIVELKRRDTRGRRLTLEAYLQTLRNGVMDLSEAISARYLSHSTASRLTPTT